MNKEDHLKNSVEKRLRRQSLFRRLIKVLLIVAIFFFIGSLGYAWFVSIKNTNTYTSNEQQDELLGASNVTDSDGDGLFDWQEDLYGTSKKLLDSDGDGVSDGEEVSKGQDPNYYGEGVLDTVVSPQREIFPDFEYTVPTPKEILLPSETRINKDKVVEAPGDVVTRRALNTSGLALQQVYGAGGNNIELFRNLFLQQDSLDGEKVLQIVEENKKAAGQIALLEAPLVQSELDILSRAFADVAQSLQILIDSQELEEQVYVELVLQYNADVFALQAAITNVHRYVVAKNINFTADEPGNFFLFQL